MLRLLRQDALDAISYQMNSRPRKSFGYKCPIEVITEVVGMHHAAPALIQAVLRSAPASAIYHIGKLYITITGSCATSILITGIISIASYNNTDTHIGDIMRRWRCSRNCGA